MKIFLVAMMLAVLLASCATQPTMVSSTPRGQIHPVYAAGGVVSVGSGVLGVLSGNPFDVAKGIFDLFTAATDFNNAVNKITIKEDK